MNDLTKVINGGYCIGCGACAFIAPLAIKITENEFLEYQAQIIPESDENSLFEASTVCPFTNDGLNEDELSSRIFDRETGEYYDVVGYYKSLYAGHVVDDRIRERTTSGGIITWTLRKLLEQNLIDGIIHIKKTNQVGKLFQYEFSNSLEEILNGAKSRYYPIEMSKVMDFIKNNEGRYAFVGLPCFIKAVRNLSIKEPVIGERLKFFIGLVCGHLKSKAYAELMAYEAGLDPMKLSYIDFRYKLTDRKADNYGILIEDSEGNSKVLVARETLGTNWGFGFFKYEACDYCDDIFSETADLAVGDAWLNHYTADSKGNSVIVCRNKRIDELIKKGIESNELILNPLSVEEMRQSQGGGFRHRRSGLGYRLYLKQKKNEWAPNKRMTQNRNGLSIGRKIIYKFRVYLRRKSAVLWKEVRKNKNYSAFKKNIAFPTKLYGILLQFVAFSRKLRL